MIYSGAREPVMQNVPSPRQVEAVDRDERALPSPRQGYTINTFTCI